MDDIKRNCLRSILKAKFRQNLSMVSFSSWISSHFGCSDCRRYFAFARAVANELMTSFVCVSNSSCFLKKASALVREFPSPVFFKRYSSPGPRNHSMTYGRQGKRKNVFSSIIQYAMLQQPVTMSGPEVLAPTSYLPSRYKTCKD